MMLRFPQESTESRSGLVSSPDHSSNKFRVPACSWDSHCYWRGNYKSSSQECAVCAGWAKSLGQCSDPCGSSSYTIICCLFVSKKPHERKLQSEGAKKKKKRIQTNFANCKNELTFKCSAAVSPQFSWHMWSLFCCTSAEGVILGFGGCLEVSSFPE